MDTQTKEPKEEPKPPGDDDWGVGGSIETISRGSFLNIKFPLKPYCHCRKGPSTDYNESFHITNRNTGVILNIWWRCDHTVSVGMFDQKERRKVERYKELIPTTSSFTEKDMGKIIEALK